MMPLILMVLLSLRPALAGGLEEAIRKEIAARLPRGAEITVTDVQTKGSIPASRISVISPEPPLGLVNVEWVDVTGRHRSYAHARVSALLPVAIAKQDLQAEEPLTEDKIIFQLRDLTPLAHRGYFHDMASLGNRVARGLIRAGSVLTQGTTQTPHLVRFGETVNVTLRRGLVLLTVRMRALENGRMFDKIRVENTQSKRVLVAKVVRGGELEIY